MEENIIYCLKIPINKDDYFYDLIKIGSTRNIISRMKAYKTGYYKCCLVIYYKINKNCYEIDNMIKKEFDEFRLCNQNKESGIEIYNHKELTFDLLENFFKQNDVEYQKFYKDNIINEINKPLTEKELNNNNNKDIKKLNFFNKINNKKINYN